MNVMMTKKEYAIYTCATMILRDECPPDRKHYLCMKGEDDSSTDCTQCWGDYLWAVAGGSRGDVEREGSGMTYTILGREYPVLCNITSPQTVTVPLVDLPTMSDERWEELARENAVHNFTRKFGYPLGGVEVAVEWQREEAYRMIHRLEAAV